MSDAGSSLGDFDHDHFGFNVAGTSALSCLRCHSVNVKMLESYLVCAQCGFQNDNHAFNATLEYDDFARGKAAKMKKEAVREKHDSPKKISDLRKSVVALGDQGEDVGQF